MINCKNFCNLHCAFDCPNADLERFEDRFDVPASDLGLEYIECEDCIYSDDRCTCEDCYFLGSLDCPVKGAR